MGLGWESSGLDSQLYFCCSASETFVLLLQVSENFTVALATNR
jgi:hypothetical protein